MVVGQMFRVPTVAPAPNFVIKRRDRPVVPQREGNDVPLIVGLAFARFGGVLAEGQVGPRSVIVLEVLSQDAP